MSKASTLPLILALILLVLGYNNFRGEFDHIKKATKSALESRASHFDQYLRLMAANNATIRKSMERAYTNARQEIREGKVLDSISYFAQFDVYGLSPFDHPETAGHLNGTLTIRSSQDLEDPELRSELAAVLAIDEQFGTFSEESELAIWTYYTSARGFIYLSPKHPIDEFQFHPELYQTPFWVHAAPLENPEGKQVITPLYEDTAGQGLMITISNPIIVDKQFMGVVSVDVGIKYMTMLLAIGESVGESILVDENKQLVASRHPITVGQKFPVPVFDTRGQWHGNEDGWFHSTPIRTDELYLVHTLKRSELVMSAARASATIWLVLFFGVVLSYFAYFMFMAAVRHKKLMLIDPLTKLYNRRGFFTLLEPVYAHQQRSSGNCAILMIDIDYFKKINDTRGHAIGDEVILSVGKVLTNMNRKSSICSRWGGEEFLVFLQEATFDSARLVAERIRQAVEKKKHGRKKLEVTLSVGVCVSKATDSFDSILEHADQALYEAKRNGRNQTVLFTSE